jgi:hypothetical protein
MNPKKLITAVLLVLVAGSLGYMIVRENKSTPQPAPLSGAPQAEPNQQIVVYYFHGDVRCPTCHKLENYAKEALDTYFTEDLAAGKVKWKPTNVDTPGNEHFIKDYGLVTKSVVISKIFDGRQVEWKNLDQIWQLVGDKGKYLEYIRDSVKVFAAPVRRSFSEDGEEQN